MEDLISRQAAIDLWEKFHPTIAVDAMQYDAELRQLPPAQSDIIRCNACKHWTQTTGNMPGFGLGDCDYLNAKLVNCNGYCYWAERREEND
jgi:hypothetical protein